MLPEPLGSTTWHNRHLACFQRLDALLREAGFAASGAAGDGGRAATVMVIGPGAVTRVMAGLLNDAAARPGRARKLLGDAARYGDQLLRRLPVLPMRSLEPRELHAALGVRRRLIVVDRSMRILDAVRRDLPDAECHCVDITRHDLPAEADVVVAFNVICRLTDPAAGMTRVLAALRPGGWLLIDDRSAAAWLPKDAGFVEVAPKTHHKPATEQSRP